MKKIILNHRVKLEIFKIVNSATGLIGNDHKTLRKVSRIYDFVLFSAIMASISSLWFPLETVVRNKTMFLVLDLIGCGFLIFDLGLRFSVADIKYKRFSTDSRLIFWVMPEPFIILLTILTSVGDMVFFHPEMHAYKIINDMKMLRIIRFLLFVRYTEAFIVFSAAIKRAAKPLFMTFIMIVVVMFVSSIIYYRIEMNRPHGSNHIKGYWDSLYAVIITMTTIGYGDMVPSYFGSKIFISILAIIGIFCMALPAGILASAFMIEFKNENKKHSPRTKIIKKMHSYKVNHKF